jgi:hypothetical protein
MEVWQQIQGYCFLLSCSVAAQSSKARGAALHMGDFVSYFVQLVALQPIASSQHTHTGSTAHKAHINIHALSRIRTHN